MYRPAVAVFATGCTGHDRLRSHIRRATWQANSSGSRAPYACQCDCAADVEAGMVTIR